MKTCGIIAEFNPFHNGHAYLIRYAKEVLGADGIVVVMSGEHVQRGEPAIIDKYARTEAALTLGADLVLELPVYAATGNASYFAKGAVAALNNTGIIDILLFGSESGDLKFLNARASEETSFIKDFDERPLPNDALAVEYLRALKDSGSGITPETLRRTGAGYNDMTPSADTASAAYIRSRLKASAKDAFDHMPECVSRLISSYLEKNRLMAISEYSGLLRYRLATETDLCKYAGIYPDLADKIRKHLAGYSGFEAFIQALKSKDLTYAQISRALLHILLDIRTEDARIFADDLSYCPYLRILGIRKEASGLLHEFGANASVPVISHLSDAAKMLDPKAFELLSHEICAADIYHMCATRTLPHTSEYSRFLLRM